MELDLDLDLAAQPNGLAEAVARRLGVSPDDLDPIYVIRRSLDARRGRVRFKLQLQLGGPDPFDGLGEPLPKQVALPARVAIIGAGPAGLFCAYALARQGIASVILERGKQVQPRRKDLKGLNQHNRVDPDSNYCFGEGGAGTYSDGKLYTRAKKRGDVRDVLGILALHGAPRAILSDARPHIGSNRLPGVISALRQRLEGCGVAFRFGARVSDLIVERGVVRGVTLANGDSLSCDTLVVASGHSARDVWELLARQGVQLQAKAFAVGVRIEHPQPLIDQIQYGAAARHPALPAAAYKLAHTSEGRGVFSFCMCPGGFIVPAATAPGGLVTNGMSLSRRDSPYANSGIVVGVTTEDIDAIGLSSGVALQQALESAAWEAGPPGLCAPAVRVTDFLAGRVSSSLPGSSYQPGLAAVDLGALLDGPGLPLARRLREALRVFEGKMRGWITEEAVLIGVETRTSAPVRVPRDARTLVNPQLAGLYPCGEGAGYAGGIVSAALDGMRVAAAIGGG